MSSRRNFRALWSMISQIDHDAVLLNHHDRHHHHHHHDHHHPFCSVSSASLFQQILQNLSEQEAYTERTFEGIFFKRDCIDNRKCADLVISYMNQHRSAGRNEISSREMFELLINVVAPKIGSGKPVVRFSSFLLHLLEKEKKRWSTLRNDGIYSCHSLLFPPRNVRSWR